MNGDYTLGGRNRKITKRRLIILIAVISVVSILAALAFILFKPDRQSGAPITQLVPTEQNVILPDVPEEHEPGLPVRLVIAGLDIDAPIGQLGLTENGDMDNPSNIMETGWYKYGPHPGDIGSAVIAGHLSGEKGQPGIFKNLEKLQKGDSLSVIDDKGQTISFTVRETRYYNQDEKPSEVFNTNTGAHLNLITCAGSWDRTESSFSKRLVVFSDRSN